MYVQDGTEGPSPGQCDTSKAGGHERSGRIEDRLDEIAGLFAFEGVSRKTFLKLSALALAALSLPSGCRPSSLPAAHDDPLPVLEMPPAPAGDTTVSVVRGGDIQQAVNRAIELAGGLQEIKSGDTAAIKPNLVTAARLQARVTTHPEVLRAVIRAVKERTDPSNITVVEASAYTDPSTLEVARSVGAYDVVQSERVNFLAWEDEEYVEATCFAFRNLTFRPHLPVSLLDSRFDHFINVPMLKNHEAIKSSNADYTCCLKNHVAVLKREMRSSGGGRGIHDSALGEKIAELNLAIPTYAMNIVDALTVILTGGPASITMQWTDPGLIIASKDRVACDSLGLAVLRHQASLLGINRPYVNKSVWSQAQIVRAQELNLGRHRESIRVSWDGVEEAEAILARWN